MHALSFSFGWTVVRVKHKACRSGLFTCFSASLLRTVLETAWQFVFVKDHLLIKACKELMLFLVSVFKTHYLKKWKKRSQVWGKFMFIMVVLPCLWAGLSHHCLIYPLIKYAIMTSYCLSSSLSDKFTVLSFLEALEDSVSGTSDSEESRQDDKDLRPQSCKRSDPMDESQ